MVSDFLAISNCLQAYPLMCSTAGILKDVNKRIHLQLDLENGSFLGTTWIYP